MFKIYEKNFDIQKICNSGQCFSYEDAKKELMKLYGVGIKVLDKHYPDGFPFGKYLGYAGVLQQYAFYYDLMKRNI